MWRNNFFITIRLYPEEEFSKLPATATPEMQRTNLSPAVLNLLALGIGGELFVCTAQFSFLTIEKYMYIYFFAYISDQLYSLGLISLLD